ncbi:Glutathione S-transferase 2 [Candida viswanathii]|uniref:Glutathione S-transferase 2 n=1 Tax=Candida viswanathii TaxID=5486 RepID=A0A367Y8U1_9ASCO|nr:Glutathione S-transferase 2 [Candida viswanathii]
MPLTLYTAPTGNGRKPLIFLKLLNIPHDVHLFTWPAGDQLKQEWYLKLNPHGIIPTLVDGDLVLAESNAILQYLAETYDTEGKFSYKLATNPTEYWQQQKWLFYQATQFAGTLKSFNVYIGIKADDKAFWGTILKEFATTYQVLDDQLKENKWLVGDKFTFVDLAFAIGHHRRKEVSKRIGDEVSFKDYETKYPHVEEWYSRVLAVPGIKAGLELK